jgi:hypothetical protein
MPTAKCIYCDGADGESADHVPPKLLFPLPRPSDLITVPCCRRCNQDFQRDDEYFRAVMLLRRDIADEPEAQSVMEAFYRSLERPAGFAFGKSIFDTMHQAEFRTSGGLFTGPIPAFEIENARLKRTIERITRGLFFHELGFVVPDDHKTETMLWVEEYPSFLKAMLPFFRTGDPVRKIGGGVFAYTYTVAPGTSSTTMWLFRFYQRAIMMGRTLPMTGIQPRGVEAIP